MQGWPGGMRLVSVRCLDEFTASSASTHREAVNLLRQARQRSEVLQVAVRGVGEVQVLVLGVDPDVVERVELAAEVAGVEGQRRALMESAVRPDDDRLAQQRPHLLSRTVELYGACALTTATLGAMSAPRPWLTKTSWPL